MIRDLHIDQAEAAVHRGPGTEVDKGAERQVDKGPEMQVHRGAANKVDNHLSVHMGVVPETLLRFTKSHKKKQNNYC